MHMCIDRSPCDKCKGYIKQGVILISVKDGENGDNPYRTGKFCVIKTEAAKKMFTDDVMKARICFVTDTDWGKLGLPGKEAISEEQNQGYNNQKQSVTTQQ